MILTLIATQQNLEIKTFQWSIPYKRMYGENVFIDYVMIHAKKSADYFFVKYNLCFT